MSSDWTLIISQASGVHKDLAKTQRISAAGKPVDKRSIQILLEDRYLGDKATAMDRNREHGYGPPVRLT